MNSSCIRQGNLFIQSKIKMLAQGEHMNLVRCQWKLGEDEKIVVVEYVPNGTLREHLDCLSGNILDLAARLESLDAHAVTYLLHVYRVQITPLSMETSSPQTSFSQRTFVADFGFARLVADSDAGVTHVSTQVKGTAGYLDPAYLRTYQLAGYLESLILKGQLDIWTTVFSQYHLNSNVQTSNKVETRDYLFGVFQFS